LLRRLLIASIQARARVINLSSAFLQTAPKSETKLEEALNHAARHGAITVEAAGHQGTVGSSAINPHPRVIPIRGLEYPRQTAEGIKPVKLNRPT
jgi:hypothetical protein